MATSSTSKTERTAQFDTEAWEALIAHGVAKSTPGQKQPATIDFDGLDQALARDLIERVVHSSEDLLANQLQHRLAYFVHTVAGLPDLERYAVIPSDNATGGWPVRAGMEAIVKDRLKISFDGGVQKLLNGDHNLWLVQAVLGRGREKYWAATDSAEVINEYQVTPNVKAYVARQKRVSTGLLTMTSRVPDVAAQVIASHDQQIAAMLATRQHAYVKVTEGMTVQQKAQLDAAITTHSTGYANLTRESLAAIEATTPVQKELAA